MISLKKRSSGFTIVELLIVIVVIGILAALVITTYSGIQAKARNSKRETDVQAVQTQLEAYFQQAGHYPSLADMNSTSWRTTNMKSLDAGALQDPQWSDAISACTASGVSTLASSPAVKCYAYQPTQTDGTTSCETDDTTCAAYTLTAKLEGGSDYVKKNLD